jgi:group I intron endonuclease
MPYANPTSGIYQIKNKINNKIYIGSAVNIENRFSKHRTSLNNSKHPNPHLQSAWIKYGEENFDFSILEVVVDKNDLTSREQEWIDTTQCTDKSKGYNIALIANSTIGYKYTEEQKRNISKSLKGLKIKSKRFSGKKHTDEWKILMSQKLKGRVFTEEHRNKISKANSEREWSEESKAKMSQSKKGKKLSEDTKKKMSEQRKGSKGSRAKLNENDVIEIRKRLHDGEKVSAIAKEYKVSWTTISYIRDRKNWTHI